MTQLTCDYINKLLKQDSKHYYTTHALNSILYLHYKGINKIENLDSFENLKVLYLEGNALSKLENLESLKQLNLLNIESNCIKKIENIEKLVNLNTLNISHNFIESIETIDKLFIQNIQLKNNLIGKNGFNDFSCLAQCDTIRYYYQKSSLDLSNNKIDDLYILDILGAMKNLQILYLNGNPVCQKIQNYRKTIIFKCPFLKFLDERPVTNEERIFSEVESLQKAFQTGGLEAEKKARQLHKQKQNLIQQQSLQKTKDMIQKFSEMGINQCPPDYRVHIQTNHENTFDKTRPSTSYIENLQNNQQNTGLILDSVD